MKYVVNFSGGLCSFWAAKRCVEKHGRENTVLLFADTLIEDADLYRFNRDTEQHLGIPIIRLCYGLTPWQLFRHEGIIANNRFRVCSVRLKREMLDNYRAANFEMDRNQQNAFKPSATVVIGFDWNESHRLKALQQAYPSWSIWAPMIDEPIWDKCRMIRETEALGIAIPRLYGLGFPHNNCGGACVAAGISHFVHLYHTLPDVYATWDREEQDTQADFRSRGVDDSFTILKDRRGGITRSLSLKELRTRIDAGEKFDRFEWGGCGCGAEYDDAAKMALSETARQS
jgi:hypothetical protein